MLHHPVVTRREHLLSTPMPQTLLQLGRELSKQAGLSSLEGSLPIVLQPLPAAVIRAGGKVADLTNGRNVVEERLLGFQAPISLGAPTNLPAYGSTANGQLMHTSAIATICGTCRLKPKRSQTEPILCWLNHSQALSNNGAIWSTPHQPTLCPTSLHWPSPDHLLVAARELR